MIYVFLALWGIGTGGNTPLTITIRSSFFGRKAYGKIQGTTNMFASPISFLAPVYAGWVYDTTGSYNQAFISFACIAAAAAVIMLFIRVPRLPVKPLEQKKPF